MAEASASPAADRRFLVLATLVGSVGFGLACRLLDVLANAHVYGPLSDALFVTPYWRDAVEVIAGKLPYLDFALEYPPLSLPVFVLPAVLPGGGTGFLEYRTAFEAVMTVIGMGLVPVVVATLARLGARRADVILAVGLVAASPLLVGSITISRYDLWPALLTAAATTALLWDRHRLGFALLALGVLAKVYPAVIGPIFLAYTWRRAGRREALVALSIGIAIGLAGLLPFVALAPAGAVDPFARAFARPLQIESLGATILIALHDVAGLPLDRTVFTYESYNLDGALASAAAAIQSVVLVALLAAIWLSAARGAMTRERFLLACAAAICANVAFGKVLSPQYVLWLIAPLAVLGPIKGGRPLAGLAAVLVLTTVYYPGWYARYVGGYELAATAAVLERNLGLVLLALYTAVTAGTFSGLRRSVPAPPRPPRPGRPPGRAPSAV